MSKNRACPRSTKSFKTKVIFCENNASTIETRNKMDCFDNFTLPLNLGRHKRSRIKQPKQIGIRYIGSKIFYQVLDSHISICCVWNPAHGSTFISTTVCLLLFRDQ